MRLEQREGHDFSRAIKSASHQGFSNWGSQVYLGTAAPGVQSSKARQLYENSVVNECSRFSSPQLLKALPLLPHLLQR